MFEVPETYRIKFGIYASCRGNNGAFLLPSPLVGRKLFTVASDWNQVAELSDAELLVQGLAPEFRNHGWEHVSISARFGPDFKKPSIPTWAEMCYAKDLFWSPEDVVVQFHPAKSDYVNDHPETLHLWRPIHDPLPRPPSILVGRK